MKMRIRTGYGESLTHYGGKADPPIQGLCQGNGASPAIWVGVSSLLVNRLHHMGCESKIINPIPKSTLTIAGLMFVDDMDLIQLSPEHHSRSTCI